MLTSPWSRARLNRKIFKPLGAQLVRFPPGRKGYNVRVERSHRTDDEEFYLPLLLGIKNERELVAFWGSRMGVSLLRCSGQRSGCTITTRSGAIREKAGAGRALGWSYGS